MLPLCYWPPVLFIYFTNELLRIYSLSSFFSSSRGRLQNNETQSFCSVLLLTVSFNASTHLQPPPISCSSISSDISWPICQSPPLYSTQICSAVSSPFPPNATYYTTLHKKLDSFYYLIKWWCILIFFKFSRYYK